MKIRNGFVSNSSSSSFLIYGTTLEKEEVSSLFYSLIEKDPDAISQYAKDLLNEELDEDLDLYSLTDQLSEYLGKDFDVYIIDDYDNIYVGRSWDTVRDDETGREFKNSVEKMIKDKLGLDKEAETYQEAWYS